MKHWIRFGAASTVAALSLLIAGTASAATVTSAPPSWGGQNGHGMRPAVFGSVTAISGTSLTVESKGFGQNATTADYTIDASSATVTKDGAASTVGAVAVGDMVMVEGTVSGTSVAATAVRDGMPKGGPGMGRGRMPGGAHASSTAEFANMPAGNGEPVIGGNVTAVNGSSLTVTAKAGVSYTVDATNATVTKAGQTSSVSSIASGDAVVIQGTVNGTNVTAASVMDQGAPAASGSGNATNPGHGMGGFFGAIGGFFQKLFGFF